MEFLGIGPLELIFIVIIALLLLGPKDMLKTGRTIGAFLRKIVTSEGWFEFRKSLRELRNLPYSMMREAGMEDVIEDVRDISRASKLDGQEFVPFPKKTDLPESSNSWIEPPQPEAPIQNGKQQLETQQTLEENTSIIPQISQQPVGDKSTGTDSTEA